MIRSRSIVVRKHANSFTSKSRHLTTIPPFPNYVPIEETTSINGSDQFVIADQLRDFYTNQAPVILRGMSSHFPAVTKWIDYNYLLQRIGAQALCDVEIGPYNQGEKVTIPFGQYVEYLELAAEQHNSPQQINPEHLLYLAQNDLPQELLSDIEIPSFCSDGKLSIGQGKLYSTMLWMGPAGCTSPLHFDPMDNIFIQIIGRKKVFLINKEIDFTLLYSGQKFGQQKNTSAIRDIDTQDFSNFPNFQNVAEIQVAELNPGDGLFIPSKWWHSLKSLDFCISVNTWWR
jgi:Cupin-like domain